MTSSGRPWWAFALPAIVLAGIVALLIGSAVAPVEGAGWEERVTPGERCEGTRSATFVREPFVRQEEKALPRCVEWAASFLARSRMRAHLEMMLEGEGSVAIDGRLVVSNDGTKVPQARSVFTDLGPGVHSFLASFRVRSGPAYFRLGMEDALDPHDVSVIAPLDEDVFYVRSSDAARALDAPPRARPVWQALVAALALAGAGTLAWLSIRARRGLAFPRFDLIIGASTFALALFLRARALDLQDRSWDELTYVNPALHYVRNVVLGDYFAEAWRHNLVHPPNTKWVLAVGAVLGGLDGARCVAAVLGSLAAAFVFGFGRIAFGRGVGALAGALAVGLPILVAHGRIAGHESMILFWWCGSMLAFACWLESRGVTPRSRWGGGGDGLAAFACGFAATAGVFSRATTIWIFPVLVLAWLADSRGTLPQRLRAFPIAAVAGVAGGGTLAFAMFPFMWSEQTEKLLRMKSFWAQPWGDIEVYMGKLCLPAAHYFLVAFLAETPALLLFAAAAGAVLLLLRPGPQERWGIVCALWLVVPFGQSVSTLRIGAGRYVIQAWPALLLFAAVALVALGKQVSGLAFQLSRRGRALVAAGPGVLVVIYTYVALARVEPYPLDYFDELVGGPAGVAARKMFEVPWWGEGNRAAVRALNRVAENGARVRLLLWPTHSIERLRDDLVPVDDPAHADYVLVSHLQYFARPPSGCTAIGHIAVQGAPLVDSYRCHPGSSAQLGFAAMNRHATDEAAADFRAALERDPRDPAGLFGSGWVAQVRGDLREAESLYTQAAPLAVDRGDVETEYFARFDLGVLYAEQSKNQEAAEAFRAALAIVDRAPVPDRERAWSSTLSLGRALGASGHEGEARQALLRAASLRPNDPAVAQALLSFAAPRDAGADAR